MAEELEHFGASANDFARQIGVAPDLLIRILNESEQITPEIAQKISAIWKGSDTSI